MAGELAPLVQDTCGYESVKNRGLFDPATMSQVVGAMGTRIPAYPCLWTLMILELWCRSVLDARPSELAVQACGNAAVG